jgi:hypothetical protein
LGRTASGSLSTAQKAKAWALASNGPCSWVWQALWLLFTGTLRELSRPGYRGAGSRRVCDHDGCTGGSELAPADHKIHNRPTRKVPAAVTSSCWYFPSPVTPPARAPLKQLQPLLPQAVLVVIAAAFLCVGVATAADPVCPGGWSLYVDASGMERQWVMIPVISVNLPHMFNSSRVTFSG